MVDFSELLKRYTTVTMGPAQGKIETVNAVAVPAEATGRTIAETAPRRMSPTLGRSELVVGEGACRAYLTGMFPDWQAPGTAVVLHEKRGGFAHTPPR